MLEPEYAREAIRKMFQANSQNVTVGKAEYFSRGYDNFTGGPASIGNFNDLMRPGGGGNYNHIFYGNINWCMSNDNLGAVNQLILVTSVWDLAGTSYSYTLQASHTTGSDPVVPFDGKEGSLIGTATQVVFYGKSEIYFSGYVFPIS